MSKTSKQTQTQQVDPTLAKESHSLVNLFRSLASQDPQYNRGVTIADFTPQQKAAMEASNAAASAFGMPAAAPASMPEARTSASGIKGFSIEPEVEASKSMLPASFKKAMDSWRSEVGTRTPEKSFKKHGGKK